MFEFDSFEVNSIETSGTYAKVASLILFCLITFVSIMLKRIIFMFILKNKRYFKKKRDEYREGGKVQI